MGVPPTLPTPRTWLPLVQRALAEDVGPGDVTTALVVEGNRAGAAQLEARQPLLVCGLEIAAAVFREQDSGLVFEPRSRDGDRAAPGEPLATVSGSLRSILAAERTALNFLARTCGVATWTQRFVVAVEGTGARIVDTRKTLPGWRELDKYAAAAGGALNHRMGLYDGILLKDNHLALAGGAALAVKAARAAAPAGLRIQVEVESEHEAEAAIEAGADFLLLDNWELAALRQAAGRLAQRALLEVSGGVTLDNVRAVAETGVQRISIGALTHSAPGADVALEITGGAGNTWRVDG